MRMAPLGSRGLPALLTLVFVAVGAGLAVGLPTQINERAATVIADDLGEAPIEETGVRVETIVDLSTMSPQNAFEPAFLDEEPSPLPSMYQSLPYRWIDMPRVRVREVNDERPPFTLNLDIRSYAGSDEVASTISAFDEPRERGTIDVAVSAATAEVMRVELGDRLEIVTSSQNGVLGSLRTSLGPATLRVSSIIELLPASEPLWFGDDRLHRASKIDTHDGFEVFASVLMTPEALLGSPWTEATESLARLTHAGPLTDTAPSVEQAEGWALELRRTEAANLGRSGIDDAKPITQLGRQLDRLATSRQEASNQVGAVVATFVAFVAAAVMRLTQNIVFQKRQTLAVLRSRGGSRTQIIASAGIKSAAAGGAAALVGLMIAQLLTLSRFSSGALALATLASSLFLGILTAGFVWARLERPLGGELSDVESEPGRWQRVADLLIVGIAAAAIVTIDRQGAPTDAFDGRAVLSTAAVALSVGVLARLAVGLIHRLLRLPFLATDLARRNVGSGRSLAPTLIDVIAVGCVVIGLTFAVVEASDEALIEQAWQTAQAPVRVTAQIGAQLEVDQLVETAVTTSAHGRIEGLLAAGDAPPVPAEIVAIDHEAAKLLTLGDPKRPFGTENLITLRPDGSIPVLVGRDGLGAVVADVGTIIRGIGPLDDLTMTVVGTHDARRFSGQAIVADRSVLESALDRRLTVREVWLDADADLAAIEATANVASVTVRSETEDQLRNDPQRRALRSGLRLVSVLATLVALVMVGFGAVLVADQRRTQSLLLDALGAPRATVAGAVSSELGVSLLTGVVAGIAGSAVAVRLLDPVVSPSPAVPQLPVVTVPLVFIATVILMLGLVLSFVIPRQLLARRSSGTFRSEFS